MINCPICNFIFSSDDKLCPRCQFSVSQHEFVSKDDAEYWYESEVLPFRANWLSSLSDFRINAMCLNGYKGEEKELILPFGILQIGHRAFDSNFAIQSVTIPNGTTSIKSCAFGNCENLVTVNLPDSLIRIEGYAFAGCLSLQNINLPDGLQSIEMFAFQCCLELQEIYIPQSVKYIESDTFDGCFSLRKVHIGVDTIIQEDAFSRCSSDLQIIRYPHDESKASHNICDDENWYDIYEEELTPNYKLIIDKYISEHKEVLDNYGLFVKENNLIRYAGNNTILTLPNGIKSIGNCAFNECRIENISMPSSVVKMFPSVFSDCSRLAQIRLSDELQEISDLTFFRCIRLKNVEIPSKIKKIGYQAFARTAIENLTLPETLTSIGEKAFMCCTKLESIHIPQSVTHVGKQAFEGCSNLKNVVIPQHLFNTIRNNKSCFDHCHSELIIRCY